MTQESGSAGGRRVAGKVALVTGATRGMGPVHGRLLAEHGARVIISGRNDAVGEAVAAGLRAEGLGVDYIHLDVSRNDDWAEAVERIERDYGRLDVLVNNAAMLASANVLDCPLEEWNAVIAVNQTGTFLGIKHAAPAMRRGGGGSIINISSVLGTIGTESGIAYHASKAAVHLVTRAAAVTLAPDIRVNCIVPGITATDMGASAGSERLKERLAAYPMGRAGLPIEVAYGVLFLASDESSFVTGADLRIEGGALAGVRQRRKE
jgi:NAD(P)-dependent dehydrogenase (short-subunit alcohol dehydrogenase family)